MLLPAILVANIGVPMLLLLWPAYWLAWLPSTLLQAEIAHRDLQLPRGRAVQVAGLLKLASTAVGVPLAWAGMLVLQIAVSAGLAASRLDAPGSALVGAVFWPFQRAWLDPTQDAWRVYVAFALLAVPCSLVALALERAMARRMLPAAPPQLLRAWLLRANLIGLTLLVLAVACYPIATHGRAW